MASDSRAEELGASARAFVFSLKGRSLLWGKEGRSRMNVLYQTDCVNSTNRNVAGRLNNKPLTSGRRVPHNSLFFMTAISEKAPRTQ